MTEVLSFEKVNFSWGKGPVLSDVNFSLKPGDFTTVLGPNGGGKTTLVKLALGLLVPDSGAIVLLGGKPRQERQRVGYVPQHMNFDLAYPLTVEDLVLMGILGPGRFFPGKSDRRKVSEVLESVGLEGFGSRRFSALSGGQRQRVLIARALALDPELLIMDEPTANVDTSAEDQLRLILTNLRTTMAIMVVTHDLGFIDHDVNKVLCVNRSVHLHNTSELGPHLIEELYGHSVRMVHHH